MLKFVLVLAVSPLCLAAPQEGFGDASPDEIAQIRAGTYLEMFDENPQYNFNYQVADDEEQTYMAMNENRDGDQVTGSYQYVDPFGSLVVVTYTAGPMGYSETREIKEGFVQIKAKPQKQQSSAASSSFGANSGSSLSSGGSSFSSGGSSFSSGGSSTTSSNAGSFNSGSTFSSRPQSSTTTILSPGSSSSAGQSSFTSQSSSSSFNSDDIVNSVISQVQPLISQTVSSAVSGASRRPVPAPTRAPAVNVASSGDIVSQIVAEISPLVSQTVSSAVSGSSRNSASRFSSRPAPAPRAPAPVPAPVAAPVPASRTVGSITDLFGSGGNFNVRFNTPSFNIEY